MKAAEVVVVGVAHATTCEPALAYAFEHARSVRRMLRTVHAWQELPGGDHDGRCAGKCCATAERLASWSQRYPDVPVVQDVCRANPIDALVEASKGAYLVVVGSHGRDCNSAALGTVSAGVVCRASCPVVVVRCPKEDQVSD